MEAGSEDDSSNQAESPVWFHRQRFAEMNSKAPVIQLHIEKLVLRGFDHINEAALGAALQDALARELSSAPILRDADLFRASAAVTLPAGYASEQLGGALAQAIAGIVGARDTPAQPQHDRSRGDGHG